MNGFKRGFAGERVHSGSEFIQHNAEREDIGWGGYRGATRLFRRQVAYSPGQQTSGGTGSGSVYMAGQTEIHYLDIAIMAQHQVFRLDIEVCDSSRVRRGQSVC